MVYQVSIAASHAETAFGASAHIIGSDAVLHLVALVISAPVIHTTVHMAPIAASPADVVLDAIIPIIVANDIQSPPQCSTSSLIPDHIHTNVAVMPPWSLPLFWNNS
jgi:hypothetical protein